jgi:hypothetical protein
MLPAESIRTFSVPFVAIATVFAAGKNIPVSVSVPVIGGVAAEPSTPESPVVPFIVTGIP